MPTKIGTVTTVAARDVWPDEAADFTPWLTGNIGELDRVLGIGLNEAHREQQAGAFRIDIVAGTYEDSVAIENQYGLSDHKHFGQLLTYIAHPDQEISQGIWIVEKARDEHVKAVERLNEADTVRIWMVEMTAIKIGDSFPAPVFKVVAAPPDTGEAQRSGEDLRGLKPSQVKKRDFLAALFALAQEEDLESPFKHLSPSVHGVQHTPARGQGLLYRVAVNERESRVVVTNKKPRDKPGTWLRAYDELWAESAQIAREFADAGLQKELTWWDDRPDNGRWGVNYAADASLDDPDLGKLRELNQAAAAMKTVFGPRINQLADELEDAALEPSRNDGD